MGAVHAQQVLELGARLHERWRVGGGEGGGLPAAAHSMQRWWDSYSQRWRSARADVGFVDGIHAIKKGWDFQWIYIFHVNKEWFCTGSELEKWLETSYLRYVMVDEMMFAGI